LALPCPIGKGAVPRRPIIVCIDTRYLESQISRSLALNKGVRRRDVNEKLIN
jgi:hypothetical protein